MNYIKRVQQLFFHLKAMEFIILLLSKNTSEIRDSIFDILYHTHITQMTIEALLYQHLIFIIITFACVRNMIFLEMNVQMYAWQI